MSKSKKIIRNMFRFFLYLFAVIGLLFTGVFVAMRFHLTDVKGSIDNRNSFFDQSKNIENKNFLVTKDLPAWMNTTEWETLKNGIIKDQEIILRVSKETNLPARLIVSSVIPEQLRFFTSNREAFKKYFEPLKVLGTYTQFSYGISGIKMDTAKKIENNLKDSNSQFYLGKSYENILDYQNLEDVDSERLARFTDSHDHYYSYLYTALYIKEIEMQWERNGFTIRNRPEVYATLFNIGFDRSIPKENPDVGGSIITIDGKEYTFGGLAYDFYYSNELSNIFPIIVK
ncbi:MAG: hypothetical protein EOM85_00235 [Candidatus Moranbacteria bacterium]|nr:hypothetical protein [Candidatus Moranbacteria bacterium]